MMLVIGRKLLETIKIFIPPSDTTQTIEIQVVSSTLQRSVLGITADNTIRIYRSELLEHLYPDGIDLDNVLSTIPTKKKVLVGVLDTETGEMMDGKFTGNILRKEPHENKNTRTQTE